MEIPASSSSCVSHSWCNPSASATGIIKRERNALRKSFITPIFTIHPVDSLGYLRCVVALAAHSAHSSHYLQVSHVVLGPVTVSKSTIA